MSGPGLLEVIWCEFPSFECDAEATQLLEDGRRMCSFHAHEPMTIAGFATAIEAAAGLEGAVIARRMLRRG